MAPPAPVPVTPAGPVTLAGPLTARRAPVYGRSSGTALLAVLWTYPVLWLLGASAFAWMLVCVPALLWLFHSRATVLVPRGFGLWLLFLGWVAISAVTLSDFDRVAAALYRGSIYVAAGVLLLLVLNLGERRLPTRSVVLALTALWASAVGLAVLALVAPDLEVRSVVELALPARVTDVPFIRALVHPQLAVSDPLLGTVRPTPLFPYTNNWAAGVAILTPIAVYAAITARTAVGRLLLIAGLVLSLLPIIISINRGLWLSLSVAVVYVLVRLILRGRVWSLAALVGAVALVAGALLFTSLGDVVQERIDTPNTSTRETLYQASIDAARQSPVIGYGAPVSSEGLEDSNDVSIGTHGQLWTVLVSHGFPGAALFVGFLLVMLARTWRLSDAGLWLHAAPIALLTQLPYYDPLPAGLCVAFICIALCLRDRGLRERAPHAEVSLVSARTTTGRPSHV